MDEQAYRSINLSAMAENFLYPVWGPMGTASSPHTRTGQEEKNSTMAPGPDKEGESIARRKMYPKEQWLVLKPLIHRLYIDENQTFIKVAEYLQEHHGFNPTKKQFLRRISEWGFEKNVKKDERRAILESLGEVANEGEFEAMMLRGRRLDKAKLERWRKRDGLFSAASHNGLADTLGTLDGSSNLSGGDSAPSQTELCNEDYTTEEIPRQGWNPGSMAMDQGQTFNPWLVVDVIGSPGLTELIGALTVDCCNFIPNLDLSAANSEKVVDACECMPSDKDCIAVASKEARNQQYLFKKTSSSVSFSISNVPTYIPSKERQYRIPSPFDELRPFPKSVPRRTSVFSENLKTDHLLSTSSLKMKELECRKKFKVLKTMERPAMIDLVNDMRSIAWRHYELDKYLQSEGWWRRIITVSLKIPGYGPFNILRACLWVVKNLQLQSRLKEALRLHYAVHSKITNIVGPDHQVAMLSKEVLGQIQQALGDAQSEISIYREIVQICLYRFGPKSREAVDAIGSLGVALKTCGQYQEAEALLYIFTQLDCELSHDADRNTIEAQSTVYVMSHLASCLRRQGRYGDSAAVLVATERRFKDLICLENPSGRVYFRQKAKVLKIEGQLLESEEILRGILNHAPDHPTMDKTNALASLANILAETGRQEEEATLREKKFFDDVEKYGIAYKLTIESFEELGQCYIELGWYDDAIYLFQQTIEKLALIQGSETDFCNAYTRELRDWILRVEKRRRKAEELEN